MNLKGGKSLFLISLSLAVVAVAQTPDTTGNSLLKGSFRFRHVAVQDVDDSFNPIEVTASSGTITFDGAGNYTIAGTSVDNTVSSGLPQPLNVTGTYAIGGNGAGFIANPLYPTEVNNYIYGAVSQGVYAGSSTESEQDGYILNDIFIAIPVGAAPTNASFTSSFQTGLIDFANGDSSAIKNALFELVPDGKGGIGPISLTGQASNQNADTLAQTIASGTYTFNSDASATLTIPLAAGTTLATALFTGSKVMFESSDGNFILGWTAGGYDIFFGVHALAVTGTNSLSQGLYFTTALEDSPVVGFGTDSYYGGILNTGDANGDGIVHERLNVIGGLSFDYGTDDQIDLNSDGTTPIDLNGYEYIFGAGGQAFVAIGTSGIFSLQVGLHAATFSGPGVYLNPIGVVNAASFQPITASLAPGELIALFGTGLSSTSMSMQGGQAFPTTLGGVTVTINGIACPIYYVQSTLLSVIVPYEVASNQTGLANIQVINNGVKSNVVQMYLTDGLPGSFSQSATGIGLAAARHAATGVEITPSSPAQAGETISLYLTGLGTVSPTILDGALGPASPLSYSDLYNAGNLAVYFNDYNYGSVGNPGNLAYAGLVPGIAGLYQINVQVPSGVLGSGDDVYVEFVTDAADINQIQIPYGSSFVGRSVMHPRSRRVPAARLKPGKPSAPRVVRGGQPNR